MVKNSVVHYLFFHELTAGVCQVDVGIESHFIYSVSGSDYTNHCNFNMNSGQCVDKQTQQRK